MIKRVTKEELMSVLSVFGVPGKVKLECKDKSLTVQAAANECDINQIIEKFERTGLMTHVSDRVAKYGDFSEVVDYQTALNMVHRAEEMFMELPVKLRNRFENDPLKMVEFLQDPQNAQEAVELGLVERKEVVEPKDGSDATKANASEAAAAKGA